MLEWKTYTIGAEGVQMSAHGSQAENLMHTFCSLFWQVELVQHDTVWPIQMQRDTLKIQTTTYKQDCSRYESQRRDDSYLEGQQEGL